MSKETKAPQLFDYIKMISTSKEIPEFDEHFEKTYTPFIVNRFFSLFNGNAAIIANEANLMNIPKKQHFMFLHGMIRKGKRFTKWPKQQKDGKINFLMEVYNYNFTKAKEICDLITDDQMKELREIYSKQDEFIKG